MGTATRGVDKENLLQCFCFAFVFSTMVEPARAAAAVGSLVTDVVVDVAQ